MGPDISERGRRVKTHAFGEIYFEPRCRDGAASSFCKQNGNTDPEVSPDQKNIRFVQERLREYFREIRRQVPALNSLRTNLECVRDARAIGLTYFGVDHEFFAKTGHGNSL